MSAIISQILGYLLQSNVIQIPSVSIFVHSKVLTVFLALSWVLLLSPLTGDIQCSDHSQETICELNGTWSFAHLNGKTERITHDSYPYISFVFLTLFFFNVIPSYILVFLNKSPVTADIVMNKNKTTFLDTLVEVFQTEKKFLGSFAIKGIFIELVYMCSLMLQMYLCNTVHGVPVLSAIVGNIGTLFSSYGTHHQYFPKEVNCSIVNVGQFGGSQKLEIFCMLPTNVLTIRLYEVLSVLFIIAALVDGWTILYRLLLLSSLMRR